MPGTLLVDDWQKSVEDQLRQTADAALGAVRRPLQVLQDQAPDPNQVMQSLQQTAQSAFGGLQVLGGDVQQGAQDVNAQLQQTAQQALSGLVPLQTAAPPPTPQAVTVGDQPSPLAVTEPAAIAAAPVRLGQGQSDFVTSLQPLAARVAARTGIDANVMLAIAANETGWGRSQTAQQQNNLFSIQGPSGQASRWATYQSPEESFDAFVDLISTAPRYRQAWAVRNKPDQFVDELRRAGYVADEPGYPAQGWVDQVKAINKNLPTAPGADLGTRAAGVVEQGRRILTQGAALPHSEEPGSSSDAIGDKWKTQFGFKATYTGDYRTGTPHRGVDLVPQKGGIGTPIEAFHPGTVSLIQRDTGGAGGLMVYVRDDQGLTHAYMHLQSAAPGLKVGATVNRGDVIATMGESGTEGSPHLHYEVRRGLSGDPLDQLIDPRPYMAGIPGARGAPPTARQPGGEPYDQQAASFRPPITAGQNQPGVQVLDMGQRAQQGLQVLGDAAGGIGRGIEQANQNIRTAIGGTDRTDYLNLEPSRGGGKVLGVGPPPFEAGSIGAQVESGQRDVRSLNPIEGLQYTGQALGAGLQALPPTYQALAGAKRQAIAENNPIRDVFFAGGASSMLVDAIADPITWVLPWGKVANVASSLAIQAGAKPIAGRIGGEALMNGLQNAAFEMAQPDKSPGDIGLAFVVGAGFGAGTRGIQETPQAAAIGRWLQQQQGEGWPALENVLRSRQRGELDVGLLTTGEPTPRDVPEIPPRPADQPVTARFPQVPRVGNVPPVGPDVPAGVQRLPHYPAGQAEQRFEDLARASREAAPDGLAHVALNDLPDDVMPFNVNAPTGQGQIIKLNPGGMPSLDDLRALWRANAHKSSFYVDQGDVAAPLVGGPNAEEFFTMNSIMSQLTPVARQMTESIQTMGVVRKTARDSRAAGDAPEVTRQKILDAIMDPAVNNLTSKSLNNKYRGIDKGYRTGESEVSGGPKTSVFAGTYGSAEGRYFDPRITNDIHNWRIMNVDRSMIPELRLDKKTGKQVWFMETPWEKNVANNDNAYRATEAIFRELASEAGVDGYSMQSSMWDGMRAMQLKDKASYRLWQQGFFKRAIERAQAKGVFGDITGPVEGDIQSVMNHPSVKAALATWGDYLKDPIPPELGISTVSRTYKGKGRTAALRRPSNQAFRELERIEPESDAPIVHGLSAATAERLGYDPDRGIFPWLESSHRVVQVAPDEYVVHLPAGNEDTARYVAAQVGQAADAENVRIHVPDYQAPDVVGVYAQAEPDAIQALAGALDNMGLPVIVGTGKRSLQVPLEVANDRATINAVEDAALSVGVDPKTALWEYTGRTADVPRAEYGPTTERGAPAFAPTSAERRGLLERGLGAVPEQAPPTGPPEPPGGLRRARGEASLPFGINLGGAAAGGYAGYAATPEDADWSERARNVGLGATAGLLGTRAITGGGGRLATALARGAEGFRAPGRSELEDLVLQARRKEPTGLGGVKSNRYLLEEPKAGEAPLTDDELVAHYDALEQRMEDVKARADAIDESLRNPTQKVYRPQWAAGYTNEALIEIARRQGVSAFDEAWDQGIGFDVGSGEVRYDVGESGLRGTGKKQQSPTELRAELKSLQQEEADLLAAAEQLGSAPPGARFVKRPISGEAVASGDLPFDEGPRANGVTEDVPEPVEVADAQGGRDEGARLAQEVVLSKGRGRLRSSLSEVSGEGGGVTGRAILSPERVAEVGAEAPSARTAANMPNLDSMLEGDMPEVAAQIRKSAEDNPELFEMYRQGTITFDSLRHDLASRTGMSMKDWLKTPVGKGFNERELVALQAAAVEAQGRLQDLGSAVSARGGVDKLSPEELAYSLAELTDAQRVLAVARGGRSTAGRTLNALKIRFDRTLASAITAGAEAVAAKKVAAEARKAAVRATRLLTKGRELEVEAKTAVADAKRNGAPSNIWQAIDDAYAALDRYQAMSLHEKGDEFAKLAKERAERAAARKARVRGAPEELLSALRAELKAEQDIFAGRKDTWETMAFWDSKAGEMAIEKRTAFRGQLYLEQQRKSAQIAAKEADKESKRAFDAELRRRTNQAQKAETLLKSIGGKDVGKKMLSEFLVALNDPDPLAAAKFLKGNMLPSNWVRANIVRVAGLLSAPITHMVNVGGNTGNAMLEVPTRALVVPIDAIRAKITGGERQAYAAELLPMMQAYGPGFLGSLPNAVRALKTGVTPAEMVDLSKVRPGFGSGSDLVDTAVEIPLRLLTAEDILFRSGAVSMHGRRVATREAIREGFRGKAIGERAATIVQNLEEYPALADEVFEAAARQVFQEKRTLPFISGNETAEVALARSQVVPFVRTPANITAQGAALSPLGLVGTARAARAAGEMPRGTAAERVLQGRQTLLAEERLARAMIGTGLLGAGMALGAAGMLTAGYPEDEQARSTLPQGWRPWSMRIEDPITKNTYYVPLQNLSAMGFPLAMASILTDPTHRGKTIASPEEQLNAVFAIGSYVLDNTFLQGLSDFVDIWQDPRQGASKFAEPWVASFGPYSSFNRELQRSFGVASRNPREGFIGLVDAFQANYPGLSGNVPEATTPLGAPRTQGATGLGREVPFRYDIERDEPALQALRIAGVGIPREPKVLSTGGGYGVELTETERDQLKRMRGAMITTEVAKERTRPRTAAAERTLKTASPESAAYKAALVEYNAAMQATVRDATKWANQDFEKQLGKAAIASREKVTREVEPSYLGTPQNAPVGELNP